MLGLPTFVEQEVQSFAAALLFAVVDVVAFCRLFQAEFLSVSVDADIYIFLFDIGPIKAKWFFNYPLLRFF